MKPTRILFVALWATGCNGKPDDNGGGSSLDTGWFTTTDVIDGSCADKIVVSYPAQGQDDWYWRDRPRMLTGGANHDAYDAWLQTADGERLPTTMVWNPETNLEFTLEWDGWLEANSTYTLGLTDCAAHTEITFTTSELGEPLDTSVASLIGNTYLIDLVGATWVEPAALSGLLQTYFNTPILLGIRFADETQIDLLGAPGQTDALGTVSQDTDAPTWNFPLADFSEQPFLDVTSPTISFQYSDGTPDPIDVPVEDFVFTATISADGTRMGGGVLSGFGDSRYLGTSLPGGDPGALCAIAAGVGLGCVPCADLAPYCLKLVATDLEAVLVPDLVLED